MVGSSFYRIEAEKAEAEAERIASRRVGVVAQGGEGWKEESDVLLISRRQAELRAFCARGFQAILSKLESR